MMIHDTIPPPPIPAMALPVQKIPNEGAAEVTMDPKENMIVETNKHDRGENILHSRPSNGCVLEPAIYLLSDEAIPPGAEH